MRRLALALLLLTLLGGCSLGDEGDGPPGLGVDPQDDAAGVASAIFPASGSSDRPSAVVLVDSGDWVSAIAAAVLAGPPIGAPLLLSDGGDLPAVTEDTLEHLQ